MRPTAFALVLVAACSRAETPVQITVDHPTAHAVEAPLPPPLRILGGECNPTQTVVQPEGPNGVAVYPKCGQGGKVSIVSLPLMGASAMRGNIMPQGGVRYGGNGYAGEVKVEDQRIWIESSCQMCRIMNDSVSVGELALMTDQQLAEQQTMVGLPAAPLLRTADAWRASLKSLPATR